MGPELIQAQLLEVVPMGTHAYCQNKRGEKPFQIIAYPMTRGFCEAEELERKSPRLFC